MTDIRLVQLPDEVIHALARGDLGAATAGTELPLTPYFVQADRRVWERRSEQIREHPDHAAWVTRVIWDAGRDLVTGRAGYHGPPDGAGMVEVGYSVDPEYRRQGYARAALEAMLARAKVEPEVRIVRASIRPDNEPSRNLVLQYGFRESGEQWDEEDGLEILYEVKAK
jgi:RimJ/RimL family protein N-acetyltransferase